MTRPLYAAVAVLGTLAGSLMAASPARAAFLTEPGETRKWFTTSVGPRFYWFEAEGYKNVYNDSGYGGSFQLSAGWVPVSRWVDVEVELGIGLLRKGGTALNEETGEAGSDHKLLTFVPLSASLVLGIDPVREFPVVPFGRVGLDLALWSQHAAEQVFSADESPIGAVYKSTPEDDDPDNGDGSGPKLSWHVGFGAQILLDRLEPHRAAAVDARSGINDTFLVLEGRRSLSIPLVQGDVPVDNWSLFAGLKFVY